MVLSKFTSQLSQTAHESCAVSLIIRSFPQRSKKLTNCCEPNTNQLLLFSTSASLGGWQLEAIGGREEKLILTDVSVLCAF